MMSGSANVDVDEAFRAIGDFERLSSPEAVIDRLSEYLGRYGFTSFLVTGLPVQRERLEPYILLNNWPDGWYERYTEVGHYRHDPCVRQCFSTIEPFMWSDLPPGLTEEREAMRVMEEARKIGLVDGLCVPLHDVYGFQAVVTMAGQHIELPPSARRMVHLSSLYAYGAADRIGRAKSCQKGQDRLTDREVEVLKWTAIGKTAWAIGEILGIAEFTVKDHLKNVKRKLGTSNNVHSVAEALRRHEIRL
jgi:LuxR family transcriptional regulator, quorum-sensing system regulator BjaR1